MGVWRASLPFALSWGCTSSVARRGFLLSGSGESGESLITSDSWSSLSNKPLSLENKMEKICHSNIVFFFPQLNWWFSSVTSTAYQPLWFLPAFVVCVFAAVFLRPVLPVLPLPPPLLPVLLLGGFAAAGDDAVQHSLVSVGGAGVSFHQRFQLVPHDPILFISGDNNNSNTCVTLLQRWCSRLLETKG